MRPGGGDAGGDLGSPPPAIEPKRVGENFSPEWLSGSRFWSLQSSDDEDQEEEVEVSPLKDIEKVFGYLWSTLTKVSDRDIDDSSPEVARRVLKRINMRDQQRLAFKAAMALASPEGKVSSSPLSLEKRSGKENIMIRPVMEPTVSIDDGTEEWTVVCRRRWSPAIGNGARDPRKMGNSKSHALGLARLRARSKEKTDRCGPLSTRIHNSALGRMNGDRKQRHVRVGDSIAGRVFRNILWLAWKKLRRGKPVVRRKT
jgi:hypothetical protein